MKKKSRLQKKLTYTYIFILHQKLRDRLKLMKTIIWVIVKTKA